MIDVTEMTTDQLLAAFLDACRDRNQPAAFDAIHELRYRVWRGSPLPRDVRPDPKDQAELRQISALWRARQAELSNRVADPGKGSHALTANGGRRTADGAPRDPVCGN